MILTYQEYDKLAETLSKIPNIDTAWIPDEQDVEERLDLCKEDDLFFLLWLSLTVTEPVEQEAVIRRQRILRKLYQTLELFSDS